MIIGIDIDGTVLTHEYPRLGEDIGAFVWLRMAQQLGAQFVVFTMRDGAELVAAIRRLLAERIDVYGANVNPTQWEWTMSPKPYCHLYVDDAGLGIPLTEAGYVDWNLAGPMLIEKVKAWNKAHPKGVGRLVAAKRYIGGEAVNG